MTDQPIDHTHRRPADRAALQAQAAYAAAQRPAPRTHDTDDPILEPDTSAGFHQAAPGLYGSSALAHLGDGLYEPGPLLSPDTATPGLYRNT